MKRSKEIGIVSHCLLNQNSVVYDLAREKGAFPAIAKALVDDGLGIYQLPCPEFKFLGLSRKPMSKEEYSSDEYIKLCEELADEVILDMQEYKRRGYTIKLLHGINKSPTCSITGKTGLFMEVLLPKLKKLEENILLFEVEA